MRPLSKLTIAGIAAVIICPLVGLGGTVWNIYGSFDLIKTNESAGIGAVGGAIFEALLFCLLGIFGSLVGLIMIIVGIREAKRRDS